MVSIANQQVVVAGLGASGVAAAILLQRLGAKVIALDEANGTAQKAAARKLEPLGIETRLGSSEVPDGWDDLAVVSPGIPSTSPLYQQFVRRKIPVMGELELGYRHARCLSVAITGTNGKTTTTELVERMLRHHGLRTVAAGNIGLPICEVVEQSHELDFLTLEVSSFQLETTEFFRPAIAVLLNLTPDHLDRYESLADYLGAKARIFMNQQAFDWAVVQSEALAQMRALNLKIPSKLITFSAGDSSADLYLERGMILSRMEGWQGPLLDLAKCLVRGPHNAENLMAALAVGRVLRIPLETMVNSLKAYAPAPHRCELVRTMDGVGYINDSKSTNLDSLHKALLSLPAQPGVPNVWLIAGGKDKGLGYHDVGPLLSQRVKGAFLIGETREKIRAAWSLFAPCTLMDSLLEAVSKAAENAVAGDVVLLSPACSSFDQFRNYQHRGEVFRQAVNGLTSRHLNSGVRNTSAPREHSI